ncbi:FtsX-like permease family protein [Clostridiaceae bacterium 35-E11]
MRKLDLRLLRLIKYTKGQFLSVIMVVVLALCIYVSFSMTAMNLKNTVNYYYNLTNFADISIQILKISQGEIEKLNNIEGIAQAQGRIRFEVPLQVADLHEKVKIRIISIPQKKQEINKLYMLKGNPVKHQLQGIVLLEQFANARGIKIGDQITPYINGRRYTLDVIGIAASAEYVYLMENEQSLLPAPEKFGIVYVTEAFAQSIYGYKGSYNEILIKVKDQRKIDQIIKEVEKRLDKYGVQRIIERKDQLSNRMLIEEIKQLEKTSTVVPILFLAVAAFILYMMLHRMVKNDRINIGILKALGYSNRAILLHYIKYTLLIGIVGAILGILGGIFLSGMLANLYIQYYNIPILKLDIYYDYIFYAIGLTGAFCVLSGVLGAKAVLQIMPADAMRPETPKMGGRIFLEKILFLWQRISFSWKIVIRNIVRRKKRFVFLVLGIALTYGINTVPIFQQDAMLSMFSLHYGSFQKMDYTIDFSHPMNRRAMKELKHIVEIDTIEPKLEYPFELSNGWRKKVVNIVGIPYNTEFYAFEDITKRRIHLPQKGIVLTEGLAKKLKVRQGDFIKIKNFIPGKEDIKVEVKGVVKQYLGINAYMHIGTMDKLLAEKGMITGAAITSKDDVVQKLKNIKNISSVQSVEDMENSFLQFLDSVMAATGILMLFGGVLGFAIVYNATIISISERTMEFSSLRVMGFDKKEIFHMITKENLIMTLTGIVIGIPIGWVMCNGIAHAFNTEIYTIPVILTPRTFIISAITTLGFVIIAQLATLKKIYHLNFIDALKNRIS